MASVQAALRAGAPIWLSGTAAALPQHPRLEGRHDVDVAIVGGGLTGALIAYTFAGAGVSVAVIEGGLVGRGSTAASSGLILREPDLSLAGLARRHGPAVSRRMWRLCEDSVGEFVATLRRLRISCSLEASDSVYVANTPAAAKALEDELAERRQAGFDGRWLDRRALLRLTGIDSAAAIRTAGHAHFDPYAACLGVMRAATRLGARVFECSEVERIEARRGRVRLAASGGVVDASNVVIATGYATPWFRPLAARFALYRTYVLATEPVARRAVGFARVMLWDSDRPYHYLRWTPDDRLLLGGGDRPLSARPRTTEFRMATRALLDDFRKMLPALADVRIDAAWEGLFAQTPDSLPYIGPHRRYPRHLFALGYGGNGMTYAHLAAKLLLDHWRGAPADDLRLFGFSRPGV